MRVVRLVRLPRPHLARLQQPQRLAGRQHAVEGVHHQQGRPDGAQLQHHQGEDRALVRRGQLVSSGGRLPLEADQRGDVRRAGAQQVSAGEVDRRGLHDDRHRLAQLEAVSGCPRLLRHWQL